MKHVKKLSCTIPSRLDRLSCAEKLTDQAAKLIGLSEDQHHNLAIAVTEAVGNAIVHGNALDPEKEVQINFKVSPKKIVVTIRDEGTGFNPDTLPDPLHPDNLLKESGRGIFILTQLMNNVQFKFSSKGTTIEMTMEKRVSS